MSALLLVVILSSGDDAKQAARPTDTTPPAPGRTVVATIAANPEKPQTVRATDGDLIELSVSASEAGTVSLGGYDRVESVDSTSPARFSILADILGEFPIELRPDGGAGEIRRVGVLKVAAGATS